MWEIDCIIWIGQSTQNDQWVLSNKSTVGKKKIYIEIVLHIAAIHSLEQSTLGEHIYSYLADMKETIMSLSFSPSLEYLLVGIRSSELFGYFLKIHKNSDAMHLTVRSSQQCGDRSTGGQTERDSGDNVVMLIRSPNNTDDISYLKWSARPGDGIIIGYKTYQLRCLIRQ